MNDHIHYHFNENHGQLPMIAGRPPHPPGHPDFPGHPMSPRKLADFTAETGVVLQGEQGLSAYEVAVKNGFEGTEEEWLESLRGADGFPKTLGADIRLEGTEAKVTVTEEENNLIMFHFVLPETWANPAESDSEGDTTGDTVPGASLGMGLGSSYSGG